MRMRGQALVFFALVIPIVLIPVAAYAVDAAVVATGQAHLEEVAALAAEQGAQQIDAVVLRSGGGLMVDSVKAKNVVAAAVGAAEPQASVESVAVTATQVTVILKEQIVVPINVLSRAGVTVRAQASARLVAGYDSPSRFLPFPSKTF